MGLQNHAYYQVATKAMVYKGDKVLVLTTPDGYIDFPGGRVDETERDLTWHEALRREVSEELGKDIRMNIGDTVFVSKRSYTNSGTREYIAAIYFEVTYLGGDITLSDEHGAYQWMTLQELRDHKAKFMSDNEHRQIKTYIDRKLKHSARPTE